MEEINNYLQEEETILWKQIKIKKKFHKKSLKKLGISPEDYTNFDDVHVLTNKRFIQKELNFVVNVDVSKYSKDVLERKKDIIFINLNGIQAITNDYTIIGIYVDINEYNKPVETYLGVEVSSRKEFEKFMKLITELLPLEKDRKDCYVRK